MLYTLCGIAGLLFGVMILFISKKLICNESVNENVEYWDENMQIVEDRKE